MGIDFVLTTADAVTETSRKVKLRKSGSVAFYSQWIDPKTSDSTVVLPSRTQDQFWEDIVMSCRFLRIGR
jgi:hypothetical protein